jgi:hypothetical protein
VEAAERFGITMAVNIGQEVASQAQIMNMHYCTARMLDTQVGENSDKVDRATSMRRRETFSPLRRVRIGGEPEHLVSAILGPSSLLVESVRCRFGKLDLKVNVESRKV